MKKLNILAAALVIGLASCQQATTTADVKQASTDLLNADKAWNDLAQKEGVAKAIESTYSDSILAIYADMAPMMGLDAVKSFHKAHADSGKLSWTPLKAIVASSGDLGYTYGTWQEMGKTKAGTDTTTYGVYSDLWRKQADGTWKPIVDDVSNTPKP